MLTSFSTWSDRSSVGTEVIHYNLLRRTRSSTCAPGIKSIEFNQLVVLGLPVECLYRFFYFFFSGRVRSVISFLAHIIGCAKKLDSGL